LLRRKNAYTRGIRQASRRAARAATSAATRAMRAAARFYTLIGQKNVSQTSITS
jgi:hypothetical protein